MKIFKHVSILSLSLLACLPCGGLQANSNATFAGNVTCSQTNNTALIINEDSPQEPQKTIINMTVADMVGMIHDTIAPYKNLGTPVAAVFLASYLLGRWRGREGAIVDHADPAVDLGYHLRHIAGILSHGTCIQGALARILWEVKKICHQTGLDVPGRLETVMTQIAKRWGMAGMHVIFTDDRSGGHIEYGEDYYLKQRAAE